MQKECRRIVCEAGAHPLVLKLIAGAIRTDARRRSGCATDSNADDWASVREDWQSRVAKQCERQGGPENYPSKPFLAYETSCERLQPCDLHLVATLAYFPPSVRIPRGAVEAVWHDTLPDGLHGNFADALEAVERASIVDVHPFEFYSIQEPWCGVPLPCALSSWPVAFY